MSAALPHLTGEFRGLAIRPSKKFGIIKTRSTSPISGDDNPKARSNSVTRESMAQGSNVEAFRTIEGVTPAGGRSGTPSLRGLRGGTPAPVRAESVGDALTVELAPAASAPAAASPAAGVRTRREAAERPAGVPAEFTAGRGIRAAPACHKSTLIIGNSVEPVAPLSVTAAALVAALSVEAQQRTAEQPVFGPPPRRDVGSQGRQHAGFAAYNQVAVLGSTLAAAAPPPVPVTAQRPATAPAPSSGSIAAGKPTGSRADVARGPAPSPRVRPQHAEIHEVGAVLGKADAAAAAPVRAHRSAKGGLAHHMVDSVVIGDAALSSGSAHFKTTAQATHGEHGRAALDRAPRPLFKRTEGSRLTAAANKGSKMRVLFSPKGSGASTPPKEAAAGGDDAQPADGDEDHLPVGSALRPWTGKRLKKETAVRPNTTSTGLANVMVNDVPQPIPLLPPGEDAPASPVPVHLHRWHHSSDMASILNVTGNTAEDKKAVSALRERAAAELSKTGNSPKEAAALARMVDGGESAMVSVVGNRPDRLRRGRGAANPDAALANQSSHFTIGTSSPRAGVLTGLAGKPTAKDATAADIIGFGSHPFRGATSPGGATADLAYSRRRRLSMDYRGTLVIN